MIIAGTFFILLFYVTLINGQSSVFYLEANCGTFKYKPRDRIINGRIADILQHPWMAHIATTIKCTANPGRYCLNQCGGTLITHSFVLTAAHCEFFLYSTTVTLGKSNTAQRSKNAISVGLAEIIRHPYYRGQSTHINDIALLRLDRNVPYSDYIKPVCVTNHQNLLKFNSAMFAAGWGITEHGRVSQELRRTQLSLYNRNSCQKKFGSQSPSQICAGSEKSDTCQGDSGGPMTGFYDLEGKGVTRVTQVGIVSYGDMMCGGLGVYTNVMDYYEWIKDQIFKRKPRQVLFPKIVNKRYVSQRKPNNNQGLRLPYQNRY